MTDIAVRFKCAVSAYSSAFGSAGMRVEHHVGFHIHTAIRVHEEKRMGRTACPCSYSTTILMAIAGILCVS